MHLRNIYLLLILFFSSFGYGQSLSDIKCDSVVELPSSSLVLVYNKKKTSVWNKETNSYIVQNSKSYFHYFESGSLLTEINLKKKEIYGFIPDSTSSIKSVFLGIDSIQIQLINIENLEQDYIAFLFNKKYYYNDFTENTTIKRKPNYCLGEISIQLKGQKIEIIDYTYTLHGPDSDLPMRTESGEDSLFQHSTGEYSFVYPPRDTIKYSYSKSGIYDSKTKRWDVPPIYTNFDQVNGYLLFSQDFEIWRKPSIFSIYQYINGDLELIRDSIIDNDLYIVSKLTDYDSIQQLDDKIHYYIYKNGKQGLLEVYAGNDNNIFNMEEVLSPIYDFVYYSSSQDIFISKKDSFYSITWNRAYQKDKNIKNIISNYIYNDFGYHQINDSLLIITDLVSEVEHDLPLSSIYGEDSISFINDYGEYYYVYPPIAPGFYHSGVYNLNQNTWIITPNEYSIKFIEKDTLEIQKMIIRHLCKDGLGSLVFYNLNGQIISE